MAERLKDGRLRHDSSSADKVKKSKNAVSGE